MARNHGHMTKNDIVYILKGEPSEELRYSIRSVVKNFPYRNIVFYGGCPQDIKPDIFVEFLQYGDGKMARTHSTLRAIMQDDNLTDDIWLFNDDFFIMKPFTEETTICNHNLFDVISRIENSRGGRSSKYTRKLRRTAAFLDYYKYGSISYESHTPILINRKKGLYILDNFPADVCFRSTYGNYYKVPGIEQDDVKIVQPFIGPTEKDALLSTNNRSFQYYIVGQFIREHFPSPTRYEK